MQYYVMLQYSIVYHNIMYSSLAAAERPSWGAPFGAGSELPARGAGERGAGGQGYLSFAIWCFRAQGFRLFRVLWFYGLTK